MNLAKIVDQIAEKNPLHAKKLRRTIDLKDEEYLQWSEDFLTEYMRFLKASGIELEEALDHYLRIVSDMMFEQIQFLRTGHYSCQSFEEAYTRVYSRPEVMEYYMNGLLLSQVLWAHHYGIFRYFSETLGELASSTQRYLEVGGGHGAYLAEAAKLLGADCHLEMLDISPHSLNMAKLFVASERVHFQLGDIFEYQNDQSFDLIVLGEVIEHVEKPSLLLQTIAKLLRPGGKLFLTAPINAPAIDHISLFRSPEDLRELFASSNWKIRHELIIPTESVSLESALERKLPVLFAALLETP